MRVRTVVQWSLLLPLAAFPAAAQAQEEGLEEVVQELFITETVYPQGQGEVQLTVDSNLETGYLGRFTAEYGITDQLQVMGSTPVVQDDDGSTNGEWSVGALYNLLNTQALAASVEVEAEFSSADDVVFEPALIAARQLGPMLQVHGTVSAAFGDETEYFSGPGAMMDAGMFSPTLELTASGQEHLETTIGLTPGIYLHLGHHAEIGAAAPIRLHGHDLPELRAIATLEF
ncbi:MAG TPA: hypothetical protein VFT45_25830 [Longimicrobium sp.]|nr:hypothetical protein [Longimicrobium sp.]